MKYGTLHFLVGLLFWTAVAAHAQFGTAATNSTITIVSYSGTGGAVTIPDAINGLPVVAIGQAAFANSTLTSIIIPPSITNIGEGAFFSCMALTNITVASQNPDFSSSSGILFDKDLTTLIQYPTGTSNATCTIPITVTNIGVLAFANAFLLKAVLFEGNAPSTAYGSFAVEFAYIDEPLTLTAFYRPGTSGWDAFSTNTGLPTTLWNPSIQTTDGNFGIRNNRFGFNITAHSNLPVLVEASANLANPIWTPAQSLTLTNGTAYFSEPLQANVPANFYRLDFP